MARKLKLITRLRIDEGSLVDRPANPGAAVLLWKRADPEDGEGEAEVEKGGAAPEAMRATIDRNLALLRSDLVAILAEPAGEREALVREALASVANDLLMELPEPQEDPEMDSRLNTDELDRMLQFSRAGGQTHSWTDRDIDEAMQTLAARLEPTERPEQALTKSFNDPDMRALYTMYKSAEPARQPEPVVKARAGTAAEAEIERLAARLVEQNPGMTLAHAISRVLETKEGIQAYQEHRRQVAERVAGAGGALVR